MALAGGQDTGIVDLSAVEVADYGNVALSYHDTQQTVEQTTLAVRQALMAGYLLLVVGGDHGITYPAVKAAIGGAVPRCLNSRKYIRRKHYDSSQRPELQPCCRCL